MLQCLLLFGAEFFVFSLLSRNVKTEMYRSIILPVFLYGYETWSLAVKEKYRLRVFENRMLRRIFGHKSDRGVEKTTEQEALSSVLITKYQSGDQIEMTEMGWA